MGNNFLIELPPDQAMVDLAKIKATKLLSLNLGHSIRSDKSEKYFFSCLAEIALADFLNAKLVNTTEYDLLYRDYRIEVKCKDTTVVPRSNFEASVAAYNVTQNCDIYAFTRVNKDRSMVYLCGMIKSTDFKEKAKFMKVGDIDPSNGWVVKENCWNMPYCDMPIPTLVIQYAKRLRYNVNNF